MTDIQTAALAAVATIPICYAIDDAIAAYRHRRRQRKARP